jgi:hypothetical protein
MEEEGRSDKEATKYPSEQPYHQSTDVHNKPCHHVLVLSRSRDGEVRGGMEWRDVSYQSCIDPASAPAPVEVRAKRRSHTSPRPSATIHS